jgi:hypothetical protein
MNMAETIKTGDFVSDFGQLCYVAHIDTKYKSPRAVLVDLRGKTSLQDVTSLVLMNDNQLDDDDIKTMREWAERAKHSYLDMENPNKKPQHEA